MPILKLNKKKVRQWLLVVLVCLAVPEILPRIMTPDVLSDRTYFFGFEGAPRSYDKITTTEGKAVYVTNPECTLPADTFAVNKPSNVFRVFVLGGSITYGEPWGPQGAFSRWLEERLNYATDGTHYEVINCGRPGFGSARVRVLFDEIMDYDPDCVITYTGENEGRDISFHRRELAIDSRPFFRSLKSIADHSYTFRLLFSRLVKSSITSNGGRNIAAILKCEPEDINAYDTFFERGQKLNQFIKQAHEKDSLKCTAPENVQDISPSIKSHFHPWPYGIAEKFIPNLQHMADQCRAAKVPLIFMKRAENFFDDPELFAAFRKWDCGNIAIEHVARENAIPVVDCPAALKNSFGCSIGFDAFMDSMHPSLITNQIFAREIVHVMQQEQIVPAQAIQEDHYEMYQSRLVDMMEVPGQVFAMQAWGEIVKNFDKAGQEVINHDILTLLDMACAKEPENIQTYFFKGVLAKATQNPDLARQAWQGLAVHYSSFGEN